MEAGAQGGCCVWDGVRVGTGVRIRGRGRLGERSGRRWECLE